MYKANRIDHMLCDIIKYIDDINKSIQYSIGKDKSLRDYLYNMQYHNDINFTLSDSDVTYNKVLIGRRAGYIDSLNIIIKYCD